MSFHGLFHLNALIYGALYISIFMEPIHHCSPCTKTMVCGIYIGPQGAKGSLRSHNPFGLYIRQKVHIMKNVRMKNIVPTQSYRILKS